MANIRYVCLSDLHLGEEDSLLTNLHLARSEVDPSGPSPVLEQLIACLAELLQHNDDKAPKPTLILNGDILELALCTEDMAVRIFEHFVDLAMPKGNPLFGEIIYIPGNHDHHLWETARETQYMNYIQKIPPMQQLEPAWHTTKIFMKDTDRLPSQFVSSVMQRFPHLKNFEVTVAYPNLGILSKDGRRCVIFHHGHFIESMYHLMSTLASAIFPDHPMPGDVYALEEENFAWIDFFWSVMGRSGKVGQDIEFIYEKIHTEKGIEELVHRLSKSIAPNVNIPGIPSDWLEERVLRALLNHLVKDVMGGQERQQGEQRLSEDALKGLGWYMEKMVRTQIEWEYETREKKTMPEDSVTFVFGHTHKPFEEDMSFAGYPQWVNVLNTGGWVIGSQDPGQPSSVHGGAVVLIDEELNAVNLRMYNEGTYQVRVRAPGHPGEGPSAFANDVSKLVNPMADPWLAFGKAAERAVSVRAANLKARIRRRDR